MSIVRTIRRTTRTSARRTSRGYRELARAVAAAPTRASREELLNLANAGR
jgi:hypothetical protein